MSDTPNRPRLGGLADRVALTAAARGVERAIAQELTANGVTMVAVDVKDVAERAAS